MGTELLSVGLDVGTTTTQLILSSLTVANCAGGFHVPRMQITDRKLLYRGGVHFTPLKSAALVDEAAIRELVEAEYRTAGIRKSDVDTGAIIITGETSRKENAAAVLQALSGFAGDFVAATAGPDLESVLAAKGAGAVSFSADCDIPVLHMDIGGGTTNLALIQKGSILRTGCLNVGGRLIRQKDGKITYVSPVLQGVTPLHEGAPAKEEVLAQLGKRLASVLEMAAGRIPPTPLLQQLSTREASCPWVPPKEAVIVSLSGGVAACIESLHHHDRFGDMGPTLGQAIKNSLLCRGEYRLGADAIRATVIGAGSHSACLSGSTVFMQDITLPIKNLPAIVFDHWDSHDLPEQIRQRLVQQDTEQAMLVFPNCGLMNYTQLTAFAQKLAAAKLDTLLICTGTDMAKALGQKLRLLMPHTPCLCIDGVPLTEGAYLDIGKPIGPAFPLVVKTLILGNIGN